MTLEFTEAAVLDLQSIRNYTLERWGEEQEQTYLDGLWDRFGQIKEDPERWRAPERIFFPVVGLLFRSSTSFFSV